MYVLIVFDIVHRTLAALLGMITTLFFLIFLDKVPHLPEAIGWQDEAVIVLLLGMMILLHVISTTGVFDWFAIKSYEYSGGSLMKLFIILSVLTAVFSAFLDNVTTILVIVPVTIRLAKVMEVSPVPFLMAETILSNIGGTATMIGDPPNIIIGQEMSDHLDFVDFLWNLLPAVVIMVPFILLYIRWWYADAFAKKREIENLDVLASDYRITNYFLLFKSGIVFGTVLLLFFLSPIHRVEPAWIALVGAVVLLLLSTPHDLQETLEAVEWDTLLFFGALFIAIEGLAEMGLITWIGDLLSSIISSAPKDQQLSVALILLVWASGIISAFLDNIPYTATMVRVIVQLSDDNDLPIRPLAWALAFGACLGGNGTLVGASANIVTAGIAGRYGYKIDFVDFMKVGMPVMFISLAFASAWCLVVYDAGGID